MRCFSCERLLDRYVEGTLAPRLMRAIAQHLRTCPICPVLLNELKVVDALLATTRVPELAPNFTFAVMAEVRTLPAPRPVRPVLWRFIALYLAAAWVVLVAWLGISGARAPALLAQGSAFVSRVSGAFGSLFGGTFHSLGHTTPWLVAFGFGVLLVDVAAAIGVVTIYSVVRPRLAARLASVPEVP